MQPTVNEVKSAGTGGTDYNQRSTKLNPPEREEQIATNGQRSQIRRNGYVGNYALIRKLGQKGKEFFIGKGFLICLVVDSEQGDYTFFNTDDGGMGNDTGTVTFSLAFGRDSHADFTQAVTEIDTDFRVLLEFFF